MRLCEFCHQVHANYWCRDDELVEIPHSEYRPDAGGYITLQRGALADLAFAAMAMMDPHQREGFVAAVINAEEQA